MVMNGNGNGVHMMPDGSLMAGPPMGYAPAPTAPTRSRKDIVDMVNQHERDMAPLVRRMEQDDARYLLDSHVNRDNVTGDSLPNYAVYTSNRWRVFADKVISWQSLAELLIRAPHVEAGRHQDEADNLKERFAIGNLAAANERLRRLQQPSLRSQQAFYATVRGGYIGGRALLVNRPDGTAYADITAWDPMRTHWGLGPDGLEWACYKVKKTRQQIRDEYGVELGHRGFSIPGFRPRDTSVDAEKSGVWVYDFYDGFTNTVITDHDELKPATPHGSPRVPVYMSLVGSRPMTQSESRSNLVAAVGESVYASSREVGDKINSIMSIFLEIVERARRQTVILESRDGKKTLPDDPFKQPTTISTVTGEKIYTLELQKMAAETMAFMTMIDGDWQRATLPHSSYGETPFQLSGFAITQLRQATETVLSSRIEVHESNYHQIANLLFDQFMTGAFDGMRLSGVDSSRQYFNQTITPQAVMDTCDYTVKIVSQLPQDDASKWAQAKIALETGLLSKGDIHDTVLGTQDAQQAMDKARAEKAEEGLPEAVLFTLGSAAAKRGDMTVAQMYLMEYQRIMAVKMGIMPPSPTDGSNGAGEGGKVQGKQGGGQPPEVLPDAATGAAPQPETSNNGPSYVAPGTPRPGARGQSA